MIYINILLLNMCASCALIFHFTEPVKSFICYINTFLHVLHVRSLAIVTLVAETLHQFLHNCHNVILI